MFTGESKFPNKIQDSYKLYCVDHIQQGRQVHLKQTLHFCVTNQMSHMVGILIKFLVAVMLLK